MVTKYRVLFPLQKLWNIQKSVVSNSARLQLVPLKLDYRKFFYPFPTDIDTNK